MSKVIGRQSAISSSEPSHVETEPEPKLLTMSDIELAQKQLELTRASINNKKLHSDILESKIKNKATELKGLEVEFDHHTGCIQKMEMELGKWRTLLHKSGNGESTAFLKA